jgi:hypothetical protein
MAIVQIGDGTAKLAFTSLHRASLVSSRISSPLYDLEKALRSHLHLPAKSYPDTLAIMVVVFT